MGRKKKELSRMLQRKAGEDLPSATKSFSVNDDEFLGFLDICLAEKPLRWFDPNQSELTLVTLQKKKVVMFLAEKSFGKLASKCASIFDSLIYKMSAPYRHMMFWRLTRRVFKELAKLNECEIVASLSRISANSGVSGYFLSDACIRYLAAFFVSRAVRISRLRKLCVQAASQCTAQLQLGYFVTSALLITGLLAEVYDEATKHIGFLASGYDVVAPLLSDHRFPKTLTSIEEIKASGSLSTSDPDLKGDAFHVFSDTLRLSDEDLIPLLSNRNSGKDQVEMGVICERVEDFDNGEDDDQKDLSKVTEVYQKFESKTKAKKKVLKRIRSKS